MSDGSGTINPAALTSSVSHSQPVFDTNVRGVKRSRSPEQFDEYGPAHDDEGSRKRSRLPKTPRTSGDFSGAVESLPTPSSQTSPQLQTPRPKSEDQQATSTPAQNSPPLRATPKSNVKALPTMRDHTSDQLTPEGDEYVPRESDPDGDNKVDTLGYLQGGREYRMRTFAVIGRGQKLFMLATECARVLAYRDSYLLFNKNRSLYKIIASQKEKEDLIAQDVLPYSYRSRQIALVTARSMFRQFGSRVIKDGRRVRDDYWEAKARKQGFTEADAAGEKRPGGGAQRQAAAQSQVGVRQMFAQGAVVYSNGPGFENMQPPALPHGIASTMAPLPMITSHDSRYRDISRPRQDITGPAYSDLTRSSTETDIMGQAQHGADFSKAFNQQRGMRKGMLEEWWNKPHEPPVSTPQSQAAEAITSHAFESSPRFASDHVGTAHQGILPQQPQQVMNPPATYSHQQNTMHSPIRQSNMQPSYHREHYNPQHAAQVPQPHISRSASNLSISHTPSQSHPSYPGQSYSPHPMNPPQHQQMPQGWGAPPPQPQQSPGMHRMPTPGYSPSMGHVGSPVHQQHGAAPNQSPHHGQPQQQQQPQPQPGGMPAGLMNMYGQAGAGGPMGYTGLAGMGMGSSMGQQRGMYAAGPGQQFMPNQNWPGGQAGGGVGGGGGMGGVTSAGANYAGQGYQ